MVSILVLIGIVIMVAPMILFADLENAYVLGSNLGLVIKVGPEPVASDNLEPGEVVRSTMILENNGSVPFEVYFKTNIKQGSEMSPRGGNLTDSLLVEIKTGEQILVPQMSFSEAAHLLQISIAQMEVGSKRVLDFEVTFPESANNDYQGATFQAYWTFVTVGNNSPTIENSTDPAEQTISTERTIPTETQAGMTLETENIVEEVTPLGEAVTTENLDKIFDEEIPLNSALPKTGQLGAVYFWLTGLSLIGAGVWLLRKNSI